METLLDKISSPSDLKQLDASKIPVLAAEIREFIIESTSVTGGHVGANLGVVELTLALHRCFESPLDQFLFDTGHQGYTHKLITGRMALFKSLNSYGGMNRFVTPTESEHDPIEASHAGTAVSVGLGLALAKKIAGDSSFVIVTVGDGALVEGVCFEALNHALVENVNLLVVVNDNGYAISPGFGALHNTLQASDGKAKQFFEGLGAKYLGPVDGHDITALSKAFEQAKSNGGVWIAHAKTVKAKGLKPADSHPFRMHFSFPFDSVTGELTGNETPKATYPDIVAGVINKYMAANEKAVCITPSTLYATGLSQVFEAYPSRCFDPGMEEQHALSMCVGFALGKVLPIIAFQATFLQRAFDQLIHDVAFANKPCLILSYRSGFSGYDNPTHHGIYDIGYLRPIPNLSVYYPKDGAEAQAMVSRVLETIRSPVVIMMPYGSAESLPQTTNTNPDDLDVLAPEQLCDGCDLTVIAVGNKIKQCIEMVEKLTEQGVSARLINIRQLKPLPEKALISLIGNHKRVFVVEEAVQSGGIGESIAAMLMRNGMTDISFIQQALPTQFIETGSNPELEQLYGLDAEGLYLRVRNSWFKDL